MSQFDTDAIRRALVQPVVASARRICLVLATDQYANGIRCVSGLQGLTTDSEDAL